MKSFLIFVVILFSFPALSQYQIGHFNVTFQDPDRGNRNIETEIYYPSVSTGNSTPISSGQFPVIVFGHGRYGYWRYIFRYQNVNFELIGYDESNGGAVVSSELSINFLTKKKLTRENTNEDSQGGDEIFKETWENIEIDHLIKLSDIKDINELDMHKY